MGAKYPQAFYDPYMTLNSKPFITNDLGRHSNIPAQGELFPPLDQRSRMFFTSPKEAPGADGSNLDPVNIDPLNK